MNRTLFWVVAVMLALCAPAWGAGVEIAVGGWQQSPGGTIDYKGQSATDQIDVEKDLRYDDETKVYGRLKIDMPLVLPNIYLVAAPAEFDGLGRKDVNFKFGDETFTANVDFYSKVTFNQYDVAFYYGLPFLRTATAGTVNLDVGINARILDLAAEVRQDATGLSEKESVTVPVPMAYAALTIAPSERFAIEAEGRGISYSGNSLYSLVGRVRVQVVGPLFVAASYRYDKLEIDEDDLEVDLEISGPVVEVGMRF